MGLVRLRQCLWRNGYAAVFAGLALPALITTARAQDIDFLDGITLELPPFPPMRNSLYDSASTQILVAQADAAPASPGGVPGAEAAEPAALPPAATAPTTTAPLPPMTMGSIIDGFDPDSPFTQLLDLGTSLGGPAWVVVPQVGIAEYITDNSGHTSQNKQAAAFTTVHASIAVRGDTPRVQAGLAYRVRYRTGFGAGKHNGGFTQIGSGGAHAIAVQNFLFVDFSASARELQRISYGDVNSDILTRGETTQIFTASVSPDAKWTVGSIGTSDLRYAYSRIWVERNTGPIVTSTGTLGRLTDGDVQLAHYDFRIPETIVARMVTDITAMGADHNIGGQIGRFKRAAGEAINEYGFSPDLSGIVTGGYESINAARFPLASGEGAIWNVGGRWRPNVDSSILVLYGSRDLKTSIRGMADYHITPVTTLFASYTNGINSSQGSLIGGANNSFFGLDDQGPLTSTGYEDDNALSTLGGGGFGFSGFGGSGGFSLFGRDNFNAQQNGLFRHKVFSAVLSTRIAGDHFSFRVYHSERQSLTGPTFIDGVLNLGGASPVGNLDASGARVAWAHYVSPNLSVNAMIGYRTDNIDQGKSWNLTAHADYRFTATLNARLRFDSIYHEASAGRNFTANLISIALTKTFE